jgi:hypothetical protein
MQNSYNTKTNRAMLNYLSNMRKIQNSNERYVQPYMEPEILRVVSPLYGELKGDQGESRVKKGAIQVGGGNRNTTLASKGKKPSFSHKSFSKRVNAPQQEYIKLDISELDLPNKKEKKDSSFESRNKQSNILNKLL